MLNIATKTEFRAGDYVTIAIPDHLPKSWKNWEDTINNHKGRLANGVFKLKDPNMDSDGVNWTLEDYLEAKMPGVGLDVVTVFRSFYIIHDSWLTRAAPPKLAGEDSRFPVIKEFDCAFRPGDYVSVHVPNVIPDGWSGWKYSLEEQRETLAKGSFKLLSSHDDKDGLSWAIKYPHSTLCVVHDSWLKRADPPTDLKVQPLQDCGLFFGSAQEEIEKDEDDTDALDAKDRLEEKQRIAEVIEKTGNNLDAYIAKRKKPTTAVPTYQIRWERIIGVMLALFAFVVVAVKLFRH